jgi:hypothetical protein
MLEISVRSNSAVVMVSSRGCSNETERCCHESAVTSNITTLSRSAVNSNQNIYYTEAKVPIPYLQYDWLHSCYQKKKKTKEKKAENENLNHIQKLYTAIVAYYLGALSIIYSDKCMEQISY